MRKFWRNFGRNFFPALALANPIFSTLRAFPCHPNFSSCPDSHKWIIFDSYRQIVDVFRTNARRQHGSSSVFKSKAQAIAFILVLPVSTYPYPWDGHRLGKALTYICIYIIYNLRILACMHGCAPRSHIIHNPLLPEMTSTCQGCPCQISLVSVSSSS